MERDMAKPKKKTKPNNSSVRVRDLKASKDPKGGLIGLLGPRQSGQTIIKM